MPLPHPFSRALSMLCFLHLNFPWFSPHDLGNTEDFRLFEGGRGSEESIL